MKLAPTSSNTSPGRVLFLRTAASKERLRHALAGGNVEQTMAAPVTAILAYDTRFFEKLPLLAPSRPGGKQATASRRRPSSRKRSRCKAGPCRRPTSFWRRARSGSIAAPWAGFDNAKVDAEFLRTGHGVRRSFRSNILVNLGHGDPAKLRPRDPRLAFEEACVLL